MRCSASVETRDPFEGYVESRDGNLIGPFPAETPWPERPIGLGVVRCPTRVAIAEQPSAGISAEQLAVWLSSQGIALAEIASHFGITPRQVRDAVARRRTERAAAGRSRLARSR